MMFSMPGSNKRQVSKFCLISYIQSSRSKEPRPVVPNLWPAGQKWPARPQKVALGLLKNFKNVCAKTAKLPILTG